MCGRVGVDVSRCEYVSMRVVVSAEAMLVPISGSADSSKNNSTES